MEERSQKASRAQERVQTMRKKRLLYERKKGQRVVEQSFRTSARTVVPTRVLKAVVNSAKPHRRSKRPVPWVDISEDALLGRCGSNLCQADCSYDHWGVGFESDLDTHMQAWDCEHQAVSSARKMPCVSLVIGGGDCAGSCIAWADVEVALDTVGVGALQMQAAHVATTLDWEGLLKSGVLLPDHVAEVVHAIFQAMGVDLEDATLQTRAAKALEHLASMQASNAAAIAACGGVQVLAQVAEAHKGSPMLQELVCKLLRVITICGPSCQASVASGGGVRVVVNAMTHHFASVTVQLAACRALKELAAHSTSIQEEIFTYSGVEAVLSAMERHASAASIQELGCGVLRNISAGNAKKQNKIAMLGGVHLVSVALALHRQERAVQWAGCWALFCLTVQNAELRDKVVASGGLGHVLQAMSEHRSAPRVQEAGCWAVTVLATVAEKNVAMAARASVSRAMADHASDEQVQKAAHAALRSAGACPATLRITQRVTLAQLGELAKTFINQRQCLSACSLDTIPE